MATRNALALGLLLGVNGPAHAQLTFDFDPVQLLPNHPGQAVEFYVFNSGPDDVRFAALDLNLQVADSGPAAEGGFGFVDGPNITTVDLLTHTPFEPNNTGAFDAGSVLQFANWSTTTATDDILLAAGDHALLATVWFDTTGFDSGEWPLSFTDTLNGPTQVFRLVDSTVVATTIAHGTGRLRIGTRLPTVPDETSALLLLGLTIPVLACRRRSPPKRAQYPPL